MNTAQELIKQALEEVPLSQETIKSLPGTLLRLEQGMNTFICNALTNELMLTSETFGTVREANYQFTRFLRNLGVITHGSGFDPPHAPSWLVSLGSDPLKRRVEFLKILILESTK